MVAKEERKHHIDPRAKHTSICSERAVYNTGDVRQ
jgi:hypothetical protein